MPRSFHWCCAHRPPTTRVSYSTAYGLIRSRRHADSTLADPNDWEVSAYREQFFSLDPFVNLPLDKVIALEDILPDRELLTSDYYLHYLKPIGLFRILGVDTAEPGGMLARLRCSRRSSEPRFKTRERELLTLLTPHLRRAIEIYAKLNRMTSERDVYAGRRKSAVGCQYYP